MEDKLELIKEGKIRLPDSLRVYGNNLKQKLEQGFPNRQFIGKHGVSWYKGKYIPVNFSEYIIKEGDGLIGKLFGKDLVKMSGLIFGTPSSKIDITIYDESLEDCVRTTTKDLNKRSGLKSQIELSSYKPGLLNPLDELGLLKIPYWAVPLGTVALYSAIKYYF